MKIDATPWLRPELADVARGLDRVVRRRHHSELEAIVDGQPVLGVVLVVGRREDVRFVRVRPGVQVGGEGHQHGPVDPHPIEQILADELRIRSGEAAAGRSRVVLEEAPRMVQATIKSDALHEGPRAQSLAPPL